MVDKTQRKTSYKSGSGLTVWEIEQFNLQTNSWYIVGDCSTNGIFIDYQIDNHNMNLARN